MKIYTIIDTWDDDGGSAWVVNYSSKRELVLCFTEILKKRDMLKEDGSVDLDNDEEWNGSVEPFTVESLVEHMLSGGCGLNYCNKNGMFGRLFVRDQELKEEFFDDDIPC